MFYRIALFIEVQLKGDTRDWKENYKAIDSVKIVFALDLNLDVFNQF